MTLSVPKLYFGYAMGSNLFFPFAAGASSVLFDDRCTAEVVFQRIARVPADDPDHRPHHDQSDGEPPRRPAARTLARLRLATSAGEGLPEELHARWDQAFGVPLLDGLGTAEQWHIFLSNRLGRIRRGTLGEVVPGFEIKVMDEEGREVPDGTMGHLWVRGGSRALGYWQQLDKSQTCFRGEWVVTGDLVRRDADGYYTYGGRADELLKVQGKWLSAVEVEGCLLQHPAVVQAAVVGVTDANGLMKPHAYVIAARAAGVARRGAEELRARAAGRVQVPPRGDLRRVAAHHSSGQGRSRAPQERRHLVSEVGSRLQGRVAVVTFDNPPVNGLSHAVRVGLARAVERAIADEAVAAVVLAGGSRHFSAGADIREFGTPAAIAEPTLRQLIELVEDAPKPVIAAIQGSCLGGGLELALAAHYRIAARDATLGLPEVKLGLIPGAGGTQRLPRLVAPARALELILGGEPVRATALGESGLLDRVVSGDPVEEAIAFAESESPPPRRTRDRAVDPAALAACCEAARVRLSSERHPLPASLRAVEAVAAAALPFDKGLTVERLAFVELMQSPESKALRHAFLAERAAGRWRTWRPTRRCGRWSRRP